MFCELQLYTVGTPNIQIGTFYSRTRGLGHCFGDFLCFHRYRRDGLPGDFSSERDIFFNFAWNRGVAINGRIY
jgi:hypothetical protein